MGVGTGEHLKLSESISKEVLLDVKMYINIEKER